MEKQIKSGKRVRDFGEVYTARKQVNDMLSLVPDKDIRTTYLEPACGNGNFLTAILKRKIALAVKKDSDINSFQTDLLYAISSIYGVDIQTDNVMESRKRLLNLLCTEYMKITSHPISGILQGIFEQILKYNIVCGNTLEMTFQDGSPLTFSDWSINTDGIMRKEYSYADMIQHGGESTKCLSQYHYTWPGLSEKKYA